MENDGIIHQDYPMISQGAIIFDLHGKADDQYIAYYIPMISP